MWLISALSLIFKLPFELIISASPRLLTVPEIFIPLKPLLSIRSCPSLSIKASSLMFKPSPVFLIARSLSLLEIVPFTFKVPSALLNSAFPFVLEARPFKVMPPAPLFETSILPLSLVILEPSSAKIPFTPVFSISRFPSLFETDAPLFTLIPEPVLSNLRLPPSFLTSPFTVNTPFLLM